MLLAVELLVALPASAVQSEIAEVISRYGLRPIEPATASPDFRLPDLRGGERALSDYAGRWVVLTFWATWCGPCRSEMPSLERLHRNRESAGLSVFGVSVDRTPGPAERFIEDYGLTFPNLWDSRGSAATAYRAESIPLSFVIDPIGRVSAVSIGARDWLALQPMIDELLELMPAGEPASTEYERAGAPLELPSTLQPPTAEVRLLDEGPEAGKPFSVEIRVRWAGHFEDYLLHPPRVQLPEEVVQEELTASTRSSDGRNVVVYRVDLEASEEGTYALDPIELVYTPRGESEAISGRIEGPTVTVSSPTFLGMRPRVWGASVAAIAILALAGVGLARRSQRRASRDDSQASGLSDELRRRLDGARSQRLQGDLRGSVLTLAEIEHELGVEGDLEQEALDRLIEGARYGGYSPSREELEAIERRVARRVKELETDPREAARAALRLRNQES